MEDPSLARVDGPKGGYQTAMWVYWAGLLLVDDDTPLVLLVAVHDVLHPGLDLGGIDAGVVLAERDVDVGATVVDLGDRGDEEL